MYAAEELAPESEEVASESKEPQEVIVPKLQELMSDLEIVSDFLPPGSFVCACYHLVHEDCQAWNRVPLRR